MAVPADSASLREGARLYRGRGCADCHGSDLGGAPAIDDPGFGTILGTNLIAGRGGKALEPLAEGNR